MLSAPLEYFLASWSKAQSNVIDLKIFSTETNKNHSDVATKYTKRQDNMNNFMEEKQRRG